MTVPILILHGGGDWRASPLESMAFAEKLHAASRIHELVVYANDDHAISANRADSNRRIVEGVPEADATGTRDVPVALR